MAAEVSVDHKSGLLKQHSAGISDPTFAKSIPASGLSIKHRQVCWSDNLCGHPSCFHEKLCHWRKLSRHQRKRTGVAHLRNFPTSLESAQIIRKQKFLESLLIDFMMPAILHGWTSIIDS